MITEGTYLGIDYGTKFMGIAVGQTITRSATALTALRANIPSFWPDLKALIGEWQPVGLVIGLPLAYDGHAQSMTEQVKDFGRACEKKFNLPIHWMDERLTTQAVREALHENQGYRGLEKTKVDAMAARLILQDWFERNQAI